MRQNFIAQFLQLLKHWLCGQVLSWSRTGPLLLTNAGCKHCSFQCISSIYTLFRCNGFIGIQKAVVDQMGIILPNSDHDLFFGASLALGSALELLLGPTTKQVMWVLYSALFIACHHLIEKWFIVVAQKKR